MNQRVKACRSGQLLLLAAVFMLTLTSAHAQDSVRKTAGNSVDLKEDPAKISRINAANAEIERKDKALLDELIQTDPVIKAAGTAAEVPADSTERTAEIRR